MQSRSLAYNICVLRYHTQKNSYNAEHLSILTNYLKRENQEKVSNKKYTKEELYLIGFNAFQINRFFRPVKDNNWQLKKIIIHNNDLIESIEELCKALNINSYRIAV
ncbi:MAG: hypothetical protein E7Z92_04370 [Cyanobacteria bacterium SIG31]|nr:hypothetical protein [Cyanobacteria bacterium SIG31]